MKTSFVETPFERVTGDALATELADEEERSRN